MAILRGAGMRANGLDTAGPGDFLQAHFYGDDDYGPILADCNYMAIVPIRPREEVQTSWERRDKTGPKYDLDRAWRKMEWFLETHDNAYPLHIMDPDLRDLELERISQAIGWPLHADWNEKVGHGA